MPSRVGDAEAVRTIGLLLAAAIVLWSGVRLTRTGRPYRVAVVNVHKLVDLGAVLFIGLIVYQASKGSAFSAFEWTVVAVSAVLVVGTFATGGVVSAGEGAPGWVLWSHRVGSWLAVASAALCALVFGPR